MKLTYSKIDILIKSQKPQYFIGSMLRGAFGYALKKVTCINPAFTCSDCFATSNCLFYEFYEEKNIYHKYRFDFNLDSDIFEFSFYLFEDSASKLPYILSAFEKLFLEYGLGKDRKKVEEFYIFLNAQEIYKNKKFSLPKEYKQNFEITSFQKDVKLSFKTPLRLKKDNKFLGAKEFKLEYLLNSIYQRYLKLTNQKQTKLPFEPTYEVVEKNLRWKQLTRYSNRQKTKMNMDGLIGDIELKNIDEKNYKLLKLGEIIGAGKQTVMGLGKIEIKDEKCK